MLLKRWLRRWREFLGADITAALDRMQPELRDLRAETAALAAAAHERHERLLAELAALRAELAGQRAEMAAHHGRDGALARQMEAALLAIALNQRGAA